MLSGIDLFTAVVKLSGKDITDYIIRALARRDYSNVTVSYNYKKAGGGNWDTDSLNGTIQGTLAGKAETETITVEQMVDTVIAELLADGHQFKVDSNSKGLSIGYSADDRTVTGKAHFLVPRKRV